MHWWRQAWLSDVKFSSSPQRSCKPKAKVVESSNANTVPMQVVLDGVTTSMELDKDKNMLDAALDAGLMHRTAASVACCTCRQVGGRQGSMNVNYAGPGEVERVSFRRARRMSRGIRGVDFDQHDALRATR